MDSDNGEFIMNGQADGSVRIIDDYDAFCADPNARKPKEYRMSLFPTNQRIVAYATRGGWKKDIYAYIPIRHLREITFTRGHEGKHDYCVTEFISHEKSDAPSIIFKMETDGHPDDLKQYMLTLLGISKLSGVAIDDYTSEDYEDPGNEQQNGKSKKDKKKEKKQRKAERKSKRNQRETDDFDEDVDDGVAEQRYPDQEYNWDGSSRQMSDGYQQRQPQRQQQQRRQPAPQQDPRLQQRRQAPQQRPQDPARASRQQQLNRQGQRTQQRRQAPQQNQRAQQQRRQAPTSRPQMTPRDGYGEDSRRRSQ